MAQLGYVFVWAADVEATLSFYERAFDLHRRFVRENGPLGLYAELETGDTTLAIADVREADMLFDEYRANQPDIPPGAFQISFITDSVDDTYRAAVKAGATSMAPPADQPWGQRLARVRDPNGVLVSITSPR